MEYLQKEADVLKVEARSGFVEDVDGFARGPLAELGGQFYPLALTAREGGAGLPELDVTHTHRLDSLELSVDFRVVLEELGGHIHRHLQHIVDVFPLVAHSQRLAVVSLPAALAAYHVHVGEEVHLYHLYASALAVLAASTLHVERETPGLVAPNLGLWGLREEAADVCKQVGVGSRVRAGCAP